ncbi:hypothetical protein G4B88_024117 [Cannabis sativa]|uniref:DUF4283 domain-containing protein n=1 Tax=Cannabis sativa TaxID=3483 RepID=A0A7J6H3I5_CANSA|nr:hypothetical protein G4B88_024117 [Cannabis sativa]
MVFIFNEWDLYCKPGEKIQGKVMLFPNQDNSVVKNIKSKLTKDQLDNALHREVYQKNEKEMWFKFGDENFIFSLAEFILSVTVSAVEHRFMQGRNERQRKNETPIILGPVQLPMLHRLVAGAGFMYSDFNIYSKKVPLEILNIIAVDVYGSFPWDEDEWEVNEEGRATVENLCAIGRLITNRSMSRSLLRTILGRVWGISKKNWGIEIKLTTKESMFLVFSFKSTQDLNRILTKNPWFLNNGTLVLERMNKFSLDWESELTRFLISGRILHLPTRSITQRNMECLAN